MLGRVREVGGYDVVLVDTRPALRAQALGAVIGASDYVVLPSPPAPMDVVALIETVRQEVRPSGVRHRVLLTRVDARSRREAEYDYRRVADEVLGDLDVNPVGRS